MLKIPDSIAEQSRSMRTGIWYDDCSLNLEFPPTWDVTTLWPVTPPELTQAQIVAGLEHPVRQPPLRILSRGARRPLVIIDDVNRPTPVAAVLPEVLRHFRDAGIPTRDVTILLAAGAHAAPHNDAVVNKVGSQIASACKVLVHNSGQPAVYLGKTSFGTPVSVSRYVVESDFIVGIGGVYPNSTAGYGGGSKLALGVLGFQSILCLHCFHRSVGRGLLPDHSSFRRDLDEIASMVRLKSMVSLHVDPELRVIRLQCGDYSTYYQEEAHFARQTFTVPAPGEADVVISNAYPSDVSVTFSLMKGATPLYQCGQAASRILLASCSEGLGGHRLFPVVDVPRYHRLTLNLKYGLMRPVPFSRKAASVLVRRVAAIRGAKARHDRPAAYKNKIWLYTPDGSRKLPRLNLAGVRSTSSWSEVIEAVEREQRHKKRQDVVVYPCAPLLNLVSAM